jgi:hypothetical protein
MLHMKTSSVLALRPGFLAGAPAATYSRDLSEPDPAARLLISPGTAYGTAWTSSATVIGHVAVVVREPAGWSPPARNAEAVRALESEDGEGLVHHHEAFFNGSLILITEDDKLREERRYRRLLDRTTVSWINNCGTPEALVSSFLSAIMPRGPVSAVRLPRRAGSGSRTGGPRRCTTCAARGGSAAGSPPRRRSPGHGR